MIESRAGGVLKAPAGLPRGAQPARRLASRPCRMGGSTPAHGSLHRSRSRSRSRSPSRSRSRSRSPSRSPSTSPSPSPSPPSRSRRSEYENWSSNAFRATEVADGTRCRRGRGGRHADRALRSGCGGADWWLRAGARRAAKRTGSVRFVGLSKRCAKTEKSLVLDQVGPRGPQGIQGVPGSDGSGPQRSRARAGGDVSGLSRPAARSPRPPGPDHSTYGANVEAWGGGALVTPHQTTASADVVPVQSSYPGIGVTGTTAAIL